MAESRVVKISSYPGLRVVFPLDPRAKKILLAVFVKRTISVTFNNTHSEIKQFQQHRPTLKYKFQQKPMILKCKLVPPTTCIDT
jgi:pyruvate/2-oxoglutarate/acetoin dehydrogenase E1 component